MPNSRIKPTIDVVAVTTSKTLATLLGTALKASTTRVSLRPHAPGIFMDDGTATASSDPLGTAMIEIQGGPGELGELQFFAVSSTNMSIIQEG